MTATSTSGRTRFCARRDCETANECTRHTSVVELRENPLQCALDQVQRPRPRRRDLHPVAELSIRTPLTRHPPALPGPPPRYLAILDEVAGEAWVPRGRSARTEFTAFRPSILMITRHVQAPSAFGVADGRCAARRKPPLFCQCSADSTAPSRACVVAWLCRGTAPSALDAEAIAGHLAELRRR